MKADLFEDHERYLDALARDLLKAGPDPGITVPVAAGLDMFALRHHAMVARSDPASVVQKAEAELGAPAFAAAVPVLLQAGAERILAARDLLEPQLGPLREALDRVSSEGQDPASARTSLAGPASAYAAAFEAGREELLSGEPDDEVRVMDGTVMLSGVWLPPDCVLESSLWAARAMGVRTRATSVSSNGTRLLAGEVGRPVRVLSLYVRVLGRPAAVRR
jgi:hypothetical protein